jgi:hypothetical protein
MTGGLPKKDLILRSAPTGRVSKDEVGSIRFPRPSRRVRWTLLRMRKSVERQQTTHPEETAPAVVSKDEAKRVVATR